MDNKVILETFGATALGNQIRWVCWKKVPKDNGGFTKPPIDPRTGKTVDIRTPEGRKQNCMTLDAAVKAYIFGECDGIGVVTGEIEGTPLCGIDIDHCLVDGKPKPEFAEAVTMVATHGYCEISPSGEGVRGFVLARKPKGYRERRGGVEVYDSGQYVTVTGNRPEWAQEPLGAGLEAVQWLCDTYLKDEPSPQREAPSVAPVAFNWQERVELAKKLEPDKFAPLWNGNRPNENESADDLGLCNKLAYYLDRDPTAVYQAFMASPHTRGKDEAHQKKLQRDDYLRNTIAKAVRECADTYSERQVREAFGNGDFDPIVPFAPPNVNSLSSFPVGSLPPAVKDFAEAVTGSIQVAPDMPATATISIGALCVQGKFKASVNRDWKEPLNLYTVIVARPSDRKSPVLRITTEGVIGYERDENERRALDVRAYETQRRVLVKAINIMTDKAAKGTGKEKVTTEMIMEKEQELLWLEQDAVRPLRLIADDTTPEALISLLAENNGKMAIISSEGGIFDIAAGRYSDGLNIDVFLKAYSGDTIRVDRKGRASEYVNDPALTMLLTIQPSVLSTVMDNPAFRGRGLVARFLYSLPVSTVGGRRFEVMPVPQEVSRNFTDLVRRLLAIPDGEERIITLSPEAYEIFKEQFNDLEPRLVDELESIEDWAGKFIGNTLRIAGILHCFIHVENADKVPISGETMRNAQEIANYYLEHAKAAFKIMGLYDSQEVKDAKYILKKLLNCGETEISKRDLFRLCDGRMANMEEMAPGLHELISRGHIRIEKVPTGGRPTERVYINPEALEYYKGDPVWMESKIVPQEQKGQKGQKEENEDG